MQEKNQSNLFIWISLVIIAAIIIGGVGLYFYFLGQKTTLENNGKNYQVITQTTTETTSKENTAIDETEDWKIYSDKFFGFSFRYPKTWSQISYSDNSDTIDLDAHYVGSDAIFISYNSKDYIFEKHRDQVKLPGNAEFRISTISRDAWGLFGHGMENYADRVETEVKVDGYKFKKTTWSGVSELGDSRYPNFKAITIYVDNPTGDYRSEIEIYYTDDENSNFAEVFDKILESFKFNIFPSDKINEILVRRQELKKIPPEFTTVEPANQTTFEKKLSETLTQEIKIKVNRIVKISIQDKEYDSKGNEINSVTVQPLEEDKYPYRNYSETPYRAIFTFQKNTTNAVITITAEDKYGNKTTKEIEYHFKEE